jgi:hypothetical protein
MHAMWKQQHVHSSNKQEYTTLPLPFNPLGVTDKMHVFGKAGEIARFST